MQIFRTAGHTFSKKAVIPDKSIRDFVYIYIKHNQVLTSMDWNYLDYVVSASLLFSNGEDYFDTLDLDDQIDYYSISLNAIKYDRSLIANEVHKVISRLSTAQLSVILFEVDEFYMFSFAERKEDKQTTVILSDWFMLNIIELDILPRIHAAYFTNHSATEFFYDFELVLARPYYIYPVSFEYANYELFPSIFIWGSDVPDRETINELLRNNYSYPLQIYEYDYVVDSQQIMLLSTEDINLELLELEMNIIKPESPFKEDDNESSYEEENDYLNELDEDLFEDPVKMLKWIEEHMQKDQMRAGNKKPRDYLIEVQESALIMNLPEPEQSKTEETDKLLHALPSPVNDFYSYPDVVVNQIVGLTSPSKTEMTMEEGQTIAKLQVPLTDYIIQSGYRIEDRRGRPGGCLWIEDRPDIENFICELRNMGFHFKRADFSSALGSPGWWWKPSQ